MSNTPPPLKIGLGAVAGAVCLILMLMNVSWAWALPDGNYRYLMIAVSVSADVGAPLLVATMGHYYGRGKIVRAAAAAVLWVIACGGEVAGATEWLKSNTAAIENPANTSERAILEAQKDLEAERATLKDIKAKLLDERREGKISELRIDRASSQKRIDELSVRTAAPRVVKVQNWFFDGNEVYCALVLSVVGQFMVWLALEVERDPPRQDGVLPDAATMELVRAFKSLSENPLTVRPDMKTRTLRTAPDTCPELLSGPSDTRPDTADDATMTGQPPDNQPIDKTASDSVRNLPDAGVRPVSGQASDKPRLVSVSDRTKARPVPDRLSDFEQKVSDLSKAGFSVRTIADRTGVAKWKVEEARKKLKEIATKGRP